MIYIYCTCIKCRFWIYQMYVIYIKLHIHNFIFYEYSTNFYDHDTRYTFCGFKSPWWGRASEPNMPIVEIRCVILGSKSSQLPQRQRFCKIAPLNLLLEKLCKNLKEEKMDQQWSKPKRMSIHVSTRGELKGIWKIQNVLVMSRRYLVSDSVDWRMLNTNNVATKTHVAHTCWYEYGIRCKYTICKVYIKVFLTTLLPADVSFFVSVAQTRTPFPRSMSLLSCKFECKIWPLCCPRLTWWHD